MLDNTRTEVFWFQKFVSKIGTAAGTLREERKEDKESFVP